jgi:hypothetical protein
MFLEGKMAGIDYDVLLKGKLKKITLEIFNNYIKEHGIKDICGFSLYSDEEAMSVSVAVNTYEHLKNSIKECPENPLDFKYNPEEWKDIIECRELDEYNKILEKTYFKLKKKQLIRHKGEIYKLCVEIIDELKEEQCFKNLSNDFLLLFSISSFDFPELVIEYNKKYNSENNSKEYEQWINEMEEDEEYDDEE